VQRWKDIAKNRRYIMKTIAIIATIQFVIAATCAIVLALPSLGMIWFAISELLAGGNSLLLYALLLVVGWWCGLWLLGRYWSAIDDKPQESLAFCLVWCSWQTAVCHSSSGWS
jgi:hypothetical protein